MLPSLAKKRYRTERQKFLGEAFCVKILQYGIHQGKIPRCCGSNPKQQWIIAGFRHREKAR